MENSTANKSEYSNIPVKKRKEYILSVLFNRGYRHINYGDSTATRSEYSNIPAVFAFNATPAYFHFGLYFFS